MIDHSWIPSICRCIDGRAFIAQAQGDEERVDRELEAGFLLDPFLFLLSSFPQP